MSQEYEYEVGDLILTYDSYGMVFGEIIEKGESMFKINPICGGIERYAYRNQIIRLITESDVEAKVLEAMKMQEAFKKFQKHKQNKIK